MIYPLYLISNINELHFEYLEQRYPEIFSLFDEFILSYRVKSVKPEEKIYAELKKHSPHKEIIYIDDRPDLISEATNLDLQSIQYSHFTALVNTLENLGVVILSDNEAASLRKIKERFIGAQNPVIIGMGNEFRGDDGIGPLLVNELNGVISPTMINVGVTLENYLNRIVNEAYQPVLIIDASRVEEEDRFRLVEASSLSDLPLHFTHNASLKLAIEYLKNSSLTDILILAVKGSLFQMGEALSRETLTAQEILKSFFKRNFFLSEI